MNAILLSNNLEEEATGLRRDAMDSLQKKDKEAANRYETAAEVVAAIARAVHKANKQEYALTH